MSHKNFNSCDEFANAIILQAVSDYREANQKLARGRRNKMAQSTKDECLQFFRSNWFAQLTELDPEFLIQKLDKEVDHDS